MWQYSATREGRPTTDQAAFTSQPSFPWFSVSDYLQTAELPDSRLAAKRRSLKSD